MSPFNTVLPSETKLRNTLLGLEHVVILFEDDSSVHQSCVVISHYEDCAWPFLFVARSHCYAANLILACRARVSRTRVSQHFQAFAEPIFEQ